MMLKEGDGEDKGGTGVGIDWIWACKAMQCIAIGGREA